MAEMDRPDDGHTRTLSQAKAADQPLAVRPGYDRWAASYDDRDPTTQLDEPLVRQLCQSIKGQQVLDVACGTGRYTRLLTDLGAQVIGADLSRPMLLRARQQLANRPVKWIQAAADCLPFANQQFDAATCGLLLDHVEHPLSVLTEIARVVRAAGLVVVSTVHPDVQILHHGQVQFRQGRSLCSIVGWIHQPQQMLADFQQAGLQITATFEPVIAATFVQRHPQWRSRLGKRALMIIAACRAPCLQDHQTS